MHNHSQDATDGFSGPGGASAPAPTLPPSTSGSVRLRVRYCECDPMNVAHHASYIAWLEIGRTELLRTSGVSYADLEKAGVFLVVAKLNVKYRRPIRYDDVVEVRSTWVGGSRVKIEHEYEVAVIERGGKPDDHIAAIASTTLACVDREGKIQELPRWLSPK
jgi:acyl-CoA thioester hydrolase